MKKPKPQYETTPEEIICKWEYNAEDVEIHPVCAALPAPEPENYKRMKADIAAHGQLHPGIVGSVVGSYSRPLIDGKTRWQICQELQIPFRFVSRKFESEDAIEDFIWTENEARRHMSLDQIAMLKTHIYAPRIEADAKARMLAGKKSPQGKKNDPVEKSPQGRTWEILRDDYGVSEHRVKLALRVRKEGSDLVQPVIDGKWTLNQAIKIIEERKEAGKEKAKEVKEEDGQHEELLVPVLDQVQGAKAAEIWAALEQAVVENFALAIERHAVWGRYREWAEAQFEKTGDPVNKGTGMRILQNGEEP